MPRNPALHSSAEQLQQAEAGLDIEALVRQGWEKYRAITTKEVQAIDMFLAFSFSTGVIVFMYRALFGTFPFNSFLSAFFSCVGLFVLTVNLRKQVTAPKDFGISAKRAYADFVVCNVILHLVVMNFMG